MKGRKLKMPPKKTEPKPKGRPKVLHPSGQAPVEKLTMLDKSRQFGESVDIVKGRHYIQDGKLFDFKTLKEVILKEVETNVLDSE